MVTVNNLNISDNINYLVTEVEAKSMPEREMETAPISTRPGDKLLSTEWRQKEIYIKGMVFANTYSDLQAAIDTMQQNFAVQSLPLQLDTERTYTANLKELKIPTQFFQNTYVEYEATFLSIDPFAYGSLLTISGSTVSGQITLSGSITISGTAFASPVLTIYPKGFSAGNTGITNIVFGYSPTGETITVSGTLNYVNPISIDHDNFLVTVSGLSVDYAGIFSRFEPGATNFTIQTNGGHPGYNWILSYQPRYYQ